jgi:DNA-binding NtrC family response regulator
MEKTKKPMYVLVLEDNDCHAELLTEIFDRHFSPVIIHIVDTVDAAFEFMKQTRYDLILSDSVVGGIPIAEHIKEIRKDHKDTPLIIVTGRGDESLAAKLIKKGASEYLVKTKETLENLPHVLEKYLKKG